MEMNIPMFTYFDIYAANNNIDYPFAVISMFQNDWTSTSEKKVVLTHPPLEEILIKVQNSEVVVSPFKKINPKEDENIYANLRDIKSLQKQNNFTNQILGTIAAQMDIFEKNIPKILPTKPNYDKPFFKPLEIAKPIKFGNNNKNEELYKILAKKLEALEFKPTNPSSSKQQINYLSGTDSKSLNNDNELEISNFNQESNANLQINRITSQKFQNRLVYNNKSIYEWNIDGISEYETLKIVQEMIMASTAYSADNDDHTIAQYLIAGFIGQLRGWWENILINA